MTSSDYGIISSAIAEMGEMNGRETDGKWLEALTANTASCIREWDVSEAWLWSDWPDRDDLVGLGAQDLGVDVVAKRRSDGRYIAIQCKSRKLDEHGRGAVIGKGEIDKFASITSRDKDFWAERWLVTNGANEIGPNADAIVKDKALPIKPVNLHYDLNGQLNGAAVEECPHCVGDYSDLGSGDNPRRTRQCMQDEAVETSVRILRAHERSDSGGIPIGEARGRLILPCGTGKTRISLRIVEELAGAGDVAVVLCPSIALVAQIRREYLQYANKPIRTIAVCSDKTAGYDPKKESSRDTEKYPWLDNSNVSEMEIKGQVTTDADEIGAWIEDAANHDRISVIFGTYQSGSRVARALRDTKTVARVMIGDEAHRTAGFRRKKRKSGDGPTDDEIRIRDFTLCHDNDMFPAKYRVYQTATPRIFDVKKKAKGGDADDYIVRSMDDEKTFGVELYRKSYREAVDNKWLADYRIIAVGVSGYDANATAALLADQTESKRLTQRQFVRGLCFALAMAGATRSEDDSAVEIKSVIGFMNSVDKSKNMVADLMRPAVADFINRRVDEDGGAWSPVNFTLEHLDAGHKVSERENAKLNLARAGANKPHGVVNVGIFGEGTDSPGLSAVAFLEPRKSAVDVIQAVGRAMRVAPGKERGYVFVPLVIDADEDVETFLSSTGPERWKELGDVLLALRAHDDRIEERLEDLLTIYAPPPPVEQRTMVGMADENTRRMTYWEHIGSAGRVVTDIAKAMKGETRWGGVFKRVNADPVIVVDAADGESAVPALSGMEAPAERSLEFSAAYSVKRREDGELDIRRDGVVRDPSDKDGAPGAVNIQKTKDRIKDMASGKRRASKVDYESERRRQARAQRRQRLGKQGWMLEQIDLHGSAITVNLLERSGLTGGRVARDANALEYGVLEAAGYMREADLQPTLDRHFGLDSLASDKRGKTADGCVTASLMLMNAFMLHDRIAKGGWIDDVGSLDAIKGDPRAAELIKEQWGAIKRWDFRAVMRPAIAVVDAAEAAGKITGVEGALRMLAGEAERIAETYAEMGSDHAGALYNKVMGNQASDGAFFTRPAAAAMAARFALDACGDVDWRDHDVWRDHKTIDIACGSGTLLVAALADMKRRAKALGASEDELVALQQRGVEDVIKGLDINPVSLQLAGAQLIADNHNIPYERMGLHAMPYGPSRDDPDRVFAGTLELLGHSGIVPVPGSLGFEDEAIESMNAWDSAKEIDDAVEDAKGARIVIMNPPFSNRTKMGEKFPKAIQQALRKRSDLLEERLIRADGGIIDFLNKNSIGPLFVRLADQLIPGERGVLAMVTPTIALSNPSGLGERLFLSERYHIDTIVTSFDVNDVNMSQKTNINESLVIMRRYESEKPDTRIINLDRMPMSERETEALFAAIDAIGVGDIPGGWGEVSYWPVDRIEAGDWTAAIWRSPVLARASANNVRDNNMRTLRDMGLMPKRTDIVESRGYTRCGSDVVGAIPTLYSKGASGQKFIHSHPDSYWMHQDYCLDGHHDRDGRRKGYLEPKNAGYLLVTFGQRLNTARLVAVAGSDRYVGTSWLPIPAADLDTAKALSVWLNSTAGRLQIMRFASKTLAFPVYQPASIGNIKIPDIWNRGIGEMLIDAWEETKHIEVPPYSDGECGVRRIWDNAVADALDWDRKELERLRRMLHREPHVRGKSYGEYAEEMEEDYIAIAAD